MGLKRVGPFLVPDFGWLNAAVRVKWLVALAFAVPLAAIVYVAIGAAPIAADRPDSWATRHFLHFTFMRSVASSARYATPPADLDSAGRIKLGAQGFAMVCANCHGAPGAGQSVVALSMNPRPQYLPRVVRQFTDSELFVIVRDGVRFSAMPAWPVATRDDEIWSMVAFLRQLPNMDAAAYAALTERQAVAGAPMIPRGADVALTPANPQRASPPKDEFLYAAPATGFGAPTLASNPIAVCGGCHGAGEGAPTQGEAPNLGIQDKAYLRAALKAYVSGARKSGYMQEIATQLSPAQIDALADYYGALAPVASPSSASADPAAIRRGEQIALHGVGETATPACANCHESRGAAVSGAPRLAGQSSVYLRRQLASMRDAGRGSTGFWNPMPAEAHDLNDADMAALAAYYASLKPTKGAADAMAAAPQAGDAAKGHVIFDRVCATCHSLDGRGDKDGFRPDLTLQSANFISQALFAFRAERRGGSKMFEVTQSLSLGDIADLAAYVQTLAPQPSTARPARAQDEQIAMSLVSKGDAARHLPACDSCHGAGGVSALPLVPRLDGQSFEYLQSRLDRFAGARIGDISGLNPMPQIAGQLTAQERAALALHYANASPLTKAQTAAAR